MFDALNSVNLEKTLLSSIIFDPMTFEGVAEKLQPKDFYFPFHRYLFEAMIECERDDKPIDEEFLKKILKQKNKLDENAFLDILTTNPLSNTSAYIDEIKDKSIKRELVALTSDIKEVAVEKDLPSNEVVDLIQQKLYKITTEAHSSDFRDSPEVVDATLKHIEEMKKRGNQGVVGVDTGFRKLNELTTGFGEGDLIIVAARPAMGKTSFALNLAEKALKDKLGVAIFSLEMPAEQLMIRMLSSITSIPMQKLKIGDLDDDQWSRLSNAMDSMSESKLFVDDNGLVDIHHVRSKLRKLKTNHPEISLAIIDYLQLMSSSGNKDRHLEVSEISRGLKLLARELNIPIIALSQLNRSLESRSDKRPMLSDLRESGAIEQDADLILFVYRDDVYKIRVEKEKEMKARQEIIGKNRNGPVGVADLVFQKSCTKFVDKGEITTEITYEDIKEAKIDIPAGI